MSRLEGARVAFEDVPPCAEAWPPDPRDYFRGRRIEVWWQNGPGSELFTRAQAPSVVLTRWEVLRRSTHTSLRVVMVEDYEAPLPSEDAAIEERDILGYFGRGRSR